MHDSIPEIWEAASFTQSHELLASFIPFALELALYGFPVWGPGS